MLNSGTRLLSACTDAEIQAYTLSLGFEFTLEDCQALREESFSTELLISAVDDYLNAYER